MKIGLVGFPGSGKTTVFNALTGSVRRDRLRRRPRQDQPRRGQGARRARRRAGEPVQPEEDHLRRDRLLRRGRGPGPDEGQGPRRTDAARHARGGRALPRGARLRRRQPARRRSRWPRRSDFEIEMNLADLILIEKRLERLKKEKGKAGEQELLREAQGAPRRRQARCARLQGLTAADLGAISGFRFLTLKPLLLVLNVAEAERGQARAGGPGGLRARSRAWAWWCWPARWRWTSPRCRPRSRRSSWPRSASPSPPPAASSAPPMPCSTSSRFLTAGEDECRAWPIAQGQQRPEGRGQDPLGHRARLHPRRGHALGGPVSSWAARPSAARPASCAWKARSTSSPTAT